MRVQYDFAWLFVDPTNKAEADGKEISKGLEELIVLYSALHPSKKLEDLQEEAKNEALEAAARMVNSGIATWKSDLDLEKVRRGLRDWEAEKAARSQKLAKRQS